MDSKLNREITSSRNVKLSATIKILHTAVIVPDESSLHVSNTCVVYIAVFERIRRWNNEEIRYFCFPCACDITALVTVDI